MNEIRARQRMKSYLLPHPVPMGELQGLQRVGRHRQHVQSEHSMGAEMSEKRHRACLKEVRCPLKEW